METDSHQTGMSEPSRAWVIIHPKTAAVSIVVNDGYHESLLAFACQRGIFLHLISVDAISKGDGMVALGYRTSLSEVDAKHLLDNWETWRKDR